MLCSLDKMKQKSIKKWDREHDMYIQEFKQKLNKIELSLRQPTSKPPPRPFDTEAFNNYLVWFRSVARTQLNAPAFQPGDILHEPNPGFDRMANIEYNRLIRDGRRYESAPPIRFVVSYRYIYMLAYIVPK
jgi:hypothetical protein